MAASISPEILGSATGVNKIDVFHPYPIERLWHGSRNKTIFINLLMKVYRGVK